jgi:hypothetical protein
LENKNKIEDRFSGVSFLASGCFVYAMCPCALGPLISCL